MYVTWLTGKYCHKDKKIYNRKIQMIAEREIAEKAYKLITLSSLTDIHLLKTCSL